MENVISLGKLIGLLFFPYSSLLDLFLETPKDKGMSSLALEWESFLMFWPLLCMYIIYVRAFL